MDYKEDIIKSRKGFVGSSDGAMLARIARDGKVPASYAKRLAVIKGIIDAEDHGKTAEMEYGDKIEQAIFYMLRMGNENYESNPRWESEIHKYDNVTLLSHPDIVRWDYDSHMLHIYEVKATKFSFEQTVETYSAQLYIHYLLGKEQTKWKDGEWTVNVYLAHYDTSEGLTDFDSEKLTVKYVDAESMRFDITAAMLILDKTLEDFTFEAEEVDIDDLPVVLRSEVVQMAEMMGKIKAMEDKIAEFKAAVYEYIVDNGIKSIKNDYVTITRVDPSETRSFDSKAFLKEYAKNDPEGEKQLRKEYEKVTKRSGYALIKLK